MPAVLSPRYDLRLSANLPVYVYLGKSPIMKKDLIHSSATTFRDALFQTKSRGPKPPLAVPHRAAVLPEARGASAGSSQFGPGLALGEWRQDADPRQRLDARPHPQGIGRGLV